LERFTEAGVLEWCAGHGLLGVLPHRARMVTLAPDFVHGTDHRGRQHTLGFTQLRYLRGNTAWSGLSLKRAAWVHDGRPASSYPMPLPTGVLLLQDIRRLDEYVEEPLSATWARFFPTVPAKQREEY